MDLTGTIVAVLPAQSGVSQSTGNAWKSQEYVIDYFWWPNQTQASKIVMRVFGEERIKQFNLQQNDEVKIRFHAEAHEYNGRWFNEIRIDNVEFVGASINKNRTQSSEEAPVNTENTTQTSTPPQDKKPDGDNDDLPF